MRIWLDGTLLHDVVMQPVGRVFAQAGCQDETGDVIVNVVNTSGEAVDAAITLGGIGTIKPHAELQVLAGASLAAENSLDNPTNVAIRTEAIGNAGASFTLKVKPYSFTVARLKTR